MRVFVITQEESFYLPAFLARLLEVRGRDTVGMVILPPLMPRSTWLSTLRDHVTVYGPRDACLQGARLLAYRGLDLMSRSGVPRRFYSVRAVALRHGVPLYSTRSVNAPAFLRRLREEVKPDVIVSVNASQVFRRDLLSLPPLGCINVHGALLPRYRGRLPSFWVLANGERETGVTVHFMNENLDDGPIILQERVSIDPGESQDSLIRKTKTLGVELLLRALDQLEAGTVAPRPNPREEATYYSFPGPADGRRFRESGHRFF